MGSDTRLPGCTSGPCKLGQAPGPLCASVSLLESGDALTQRAVLGIKGWNTCACLGE